MYVQQLKLTLLDIDFLEKQSYHFLEKQSYQVTEKRVSCMLAENHLINNRFHQFINPDTGRLFCHFRGVESTLSLLLARLDKVQEELLYYPRRRRWHRWQQRRR